MRTYQEKMEDLARTKCGHVYPWKSVTGTGDGETAYTTLVKVALRRNLMVVEAGCGHGPDIESFSPNVGRYIAYDYSHGLIEIARKNARRLSFSNVDLFVTDSSPARGGRVPADSQSVDLIISRRGPTNFILDARRILRAGGRMIQLNPMSWVPHWNTDLPEELRVEVGPNIEERIAGLLRKVGLGFETAQPYDAAEYLQGPVDLWLFLTWLRDDAPDFESVRAELEGVFDRYAGSEGLELRNRRFLWTARVD